MPHAVTPDEGRRGLPRPSVGHRRPALLVLTLLLAAALVLTLDRGADATPASAAAAAAPRVPAPTRFVDTFDNGRLDGWHRVNPPSLHRTPRWRVSRGRLVETSDTYAGSATARGIAKTGTLLVAGDPAWDDYDYQVALSSNDDDAIGAVFRYQDPANYYRFSMDKQRHYRRLVRRVDGVDTLLASRATGYASGKRYRLRVVAVGSRLQVYLNGRRQFDVRDGALPSGRVGLYSWGSSSTIADTVQVRARTADHFTIAVVPDTQFAAQGHPAMLRAQTRWLATHRATEHIAAVLQEGDVVDDMDDRLQWSRARRYYSYLDGKIPFVVAAGNHDEERLNGRRPYSKLPDAFNAFVSGFHSHGVDGARRRGDYRNTYKLVSAGGVDLLVLNVDFGPVNSVLAWAGQVAASHPHRHVILLTHDYLGTDGRLRGETDRDDKTLPHNHNPAWNDGVDMWRKLVKRHPNMQLVLNGHVIQTVSPSMPWSVARLVTPDDAGRPVYQVLTNFQTYKPGGEGYLRLFRFYPARHRVEVSTYSPYRHRYLEDDGNRFAFDGVDLGAW